MPRTTIEIHATVVIDGSQVPESFQDVADRTFPNHYTAANESARNRSSCAPSNYDDCCGVDAEAYPKQARDLPSNVQVFQGDQARALLDILFGDQRH